MQGGNDYFQSSVRPNASLPHPPLQIQVYIAVLSLTKCTKLYWLMSKSFLVTIANESVQSFRVYSPQN